MNTKASRSNSIFFLISLWISLSLACPFTPLEPEPPLEEWTVSEFANSTIDMHNLGGTKVSWGGSKSVLDDHYGNFYDEQSNLKEEDLGWSRIVHIPELVPKSIFITGGGGA